MSTHYHYVNDLFGSSDFFEHCEALGHHIAIISDSTVAELYGADLLSPFQKGGLKTHLLSFPAGEQHKTRETKAQLEDELQALGCGRDTLIIALGGGVTTDLAGFVAATYCRGVPCIYIPTTLLAMVDAAIGGKTGVNTSAGKNLIGTITEPHGVFVDTSFLKTLSQDEFKNGLVETIKHGLIAEAKLLKDLSREAEKILARDESILLPLIQRSAEIKRAIVEQDTFEIGLRQILNFGHTYGHAYERLSDYQLPHGIAVAKGLIKEMELSVQQGGLAPHEVKDLKALFDQFSIDYSDPQFSEEAVVQAMGADKKNRGGEVQVVLISEVGKGVK